MGTLIPAGDLFDHAKVSLGGDHDWRGGRHAADSILPHQRLAAFKQIQRRLDRAAQGVAQRASRQRPGKESIVGNQRAHLSQLAASACSRASRHARGVGDESSAEALRLNGILAWSNGNHARAARLWQAGIKVAQSLGANYALARLHHELGSRKLDPAHASAARTLFEKSGAAPLRAS